MSMLKDKIKIFCVMKTEQKKKKKNMTRFGAKYILKL